VYILFQYLFSTPTPVRFLSFFLGGTAYQIVDHLIFYIRNKKKTKKPDILKDYRFYRNCSECKHYEIDKLENPCITCLYNKEYTVTRKNGQLLDENFETKEKDPEVEL
jgi:hypothetical protein